MKTRRTLVFFLLICIISLSACSQKYGIRKSYAYVREEIGGNIKTDDQQRPISSGKQKKHLIYLETKPNDTLPLLTAAWIEGQAYKVQAVPITNHPVTIGRLKEEEKDVVVAPANGNKLWQLVLTPDASLGNPPMEKEGYKVLLAGTRNNKSFTYKITKEKQLATVFMP